MVAAAEMALLVAVLILCWPTSLGGSVSYLQVSGHSMLPTYRSGDLLVARAQSTYRIGEPIVYVVPRGDVGAGQRVVHRIVGGDGRNGYQMLGDNNSFRDPWHPRDADVLGRVVLRVPAAGMWLALLSRPVNVGILCASITVTCMLWPRAVPTRPRHSAVPLRRGAAPATPPGASPDEDHRLWPDGARRPARHRHAPTGERAGPRHRAATRPSNPR